MATPTNQQHLRHGRHDRLRRSKKAKAFIAERATTLNGTGTGQTFTASGAALTITGHGHAVGDGPFVVSSDTTLPAGLDAAELYWVGVVTDANTIELTTVRGGPSVVTTDAGTGIHTMTKADTEEAMYEGIRKNNSAVVAAAADVDDL